MTGWGFFEYSSDSFDRVIYRIPSAIFHIKYIVLELLNKGRRREFNLKQEQCQSIIWWPVRNKILGLKGDKY